MVIPRVGKAVAAMLVVGLSACASAPKADPAATPVSTDVAATDVIMITVNQNRMNAGDMTIYIEPAGGVRTVLGLASAGEIKTFRYPLTGNRNVRLAAIGTSGGGITSPSITVPVGQGLNWDITLNTVRLRRP